MLGSILPPKWRQGRNKARKDEEGQEETDSYLRGREDEPAIVLRRDIAVADGGHRNQALVDGDDASSKDELMGVLEASGFKPVERRESEHHFCIVQQ